MKQEYVTPKGVRYGVITPDKTGAKKFIRPVGGKVLSFVGGKMLLKLNYVHKHVDPKVLAVGDEPLLPLPEFYAPPEPSSHYVHFDWSKKDKTRRPEVGEEITVQLDATEPTRFKILAWCLTSEYKEVLDIMYPKPKAPEKKKAEKNVIPFSPADTNTYRFTAKKVVAGKDKACIGTAGAILKWSYDYFEASMTNWRAGKWELHNGRGFENMEKPPAFPGSNPALEAHYKKATAPKAEAAS